MKRGCGAKNGTSNHYLHRSHDIVKKLISLLFLPMVSGQPRTREMEVMLRFHVAKIDKIAQFYFQLSLEKTECYCFLQFLYGKRYNVRIFLYICPIIDTTKTKRDNETFIT